MSAAVLDRPDTWADVIAHLGAGDDLVHYFCCDPDRAMCGEDLTGAFVDDGDEDDGDDCQACVDVLDVGEPCGAPLCRLRVWWRGRQT